MTAVIVVKPLEGLNAWQRTLAGVRGLATVEQALTEGAQLVRRDAQHYPPERPGQRYIRTYRLRDGWSVGNLRRLSRGRMRIEVRNDVAYATYVVGPRRQAPIHAGRWRTTTKIADDTAPAVRALVQRAIYDLVRRR